MVYIDNNDYMPVDQMAPDEWFIFPELDNAEVGSPGVDGKVAISDQSGFERKAVSIFSQLSNFFNVIFKKKEPVSTTLQLRTSVWSEVNHLFEALAKRIKNSS